MTHLLTRGSRNLLAALIFSFAAGTSLSAQEKGDPDQVVPEAAPPVAEEQIPEHLLLPKDEPDGVGDRKKLLAELYRKLGEAPDEQSAKVLSSAIEKLWQRSGSDTIDLLMRRAGLLMEKEDFDDALKLLNEIVEIAPDYSEGWTRRAAVFFVQKDYGKSLRDLRSALALDPSHYKAVQGLALLMQELGDKESSLKAFRHLLKIHPYLDEAQSAINELSREVEGQGI